MAVRRMVSRWSFEMRSKRAEGQRAAREKADEVPRKRRASHAADALSKACTVRVGRRLRDRREAVLATKQRFFFFGKQFH